MSRQVKIVLIIVFSNGEVIGDLSKRSLSGIERLKPNNDTFNREWRERNRKQHIHNYVKKILCKEKETHPSVAEKIHGFKMCLCF